VAFIAFITVTATGAAATAAAATGSGVAAAADTGSSIAAAVDTGCCRGATLLSATIGCSAYIVTLLRMLITQCLCSNISALLSLHSPTAATTAATTTHKQVRRYGCR
jgi:hypothetical protein